MNSINTLLDRSESQAVDIEFPKQTNSLGGYF